MERVFSVSYTHLISIIRSSQTDKEAAARLTERFGLTDKQTAAILEMRLRRLTGLELSLIHISIYLCRQMLDLPFNDIGKKFNRDHSTVMYSVTNVEEKMKENRELREELEALRGLINEM